MEIYLVRHTAVHNPQKLCYGQSDIPLKPEWQEEFNMLKTKLGDKLRDAIFYSSPFKRCTALAAFLSNNNYKTDQRIAELNFGAWEQLPWAQIDQSSLNAWMADYVNYSIPGGESFVELQTRCIQFWEELLNEPHPKICIVSHAGVIRSILAHLLHIPLNKIFQVGVDYGGVTKITISPLGGTYHTVDYINA